MKLLEAIKQRINALHKSSIKHVDSYPEHERFFILSLTYVGICAGLSHVGLAGLYIASGIQPGAIHCPVQFNV